MKKILLAGIFVAAVLLLVPEPGLAQSREASVQRLAREASVVAVGTVTGLQSAWTADRTRIETRVSLTVDQFLKGGDGESTLTLTVPGGEVDGVGELYTHTASFKRNQEVVVFAEPDSRGSLRVAGGEEGKMLITRDAGTGRRIVDRNQPLEVITTLVRSVVKADELK